MLRTEPSAFPQPLSPPPHLRHQLRLLASVVPKVVRPVHPPASPAHPTFRCELLSPRGILGDTRELVAVAVQRQDGCAGTRDVGEGGLEGRRVKEGEKGEDGEGVGDEEVTQRCCGT